MSTATTLLTAVHSDSPALTLVFQADGQDLVIRNAKGDETYRESFKLAISRDAKAQDWARRYQDAGWTLAWEGLAAR